jgi:hypothetical protein
MAAVYVTYFSHHSSLPWPVGLNDLITPALDFTGQ